MVAIFAVRITEGIGRPAAAASGISMSPGQSRFSAEVIISTQTRSGSGPGPVVAITSAGRCWRVSPSV